MTLDGLVGYLGTWSATQRYRQATGSDPLPGLQEELAQNWSDPRVPKVVRWPLALRVGRKQAWPSDVASVKGRWSIQV